MLKTAGNTYTGAGKRLKSKATNSVDINRKYERVEIEEVKERPRECRAHREREKRIARQTEDVVEKEVNGMEIAGC